MNVCKLKQIMLLKAKSAKEASKELISLGTKEKNDILFAMSKALKQNIEKILSYNEMDIVAAKKVGGSSILIDRLTLNKERVINIINNIKDVINLEDPVWSVIEEYKPSIDIDIKKIRVPLGVIAMIYEARPDVTVDATALCLKAGNAIILKGGSEAINSNKILSEIIYNAGIEAGMPAGSIQFIDTTDRSVVQELLQLDNFIDLLIPRGSEELVEFIKRNSSIPVLSHGRGLCHTYIDENADINMAIDIAVNAKCQRPSVCNAMETLLIHKGVAHKVLPKLCKLYNDAKVEIMGCEIASNIVNSIKLATEKDWQTEYLDLKISIKVVNSLEEAISHINRYGSMHSEAIVTNNKKVADEFISNIDAAAVFVNASTRLHDGNVFGLGCEIGISTQKLHARGTMGVKELTSTKYVVRGKGTIRT